MYKIYTGLRLLKFHPEIAIICGSGLKDIVSVKDVKRVYYKELGFKFAQLEGHERFFEFGTLDNGKKIVVCSRFHYYENGTTDDIYLLYRVLKKIGVKTVIATTAVGAINKEFKQGDLILLTDHINYSGINPLVDRKPIKFVDMTNAYTDSLMELAKKVAVKKKIALKEGVHLQVVGPSYETPAEVNFFRKIGADTVSMSMALDAICVKYNEMQFLGFGCVANPAAKDNNKEITHDEVLKNEKVVAKKLKKLLGGILDEI